MRGHKGMVQDQFLGQHNRVTQYNASSVKKKILWE